MHITEGVLTGPSMAVTLVAGAAAVAWGAAAMNRFVKEKPERRPLLGMAGAFIFLVSLIPLPSFGGTCSHPCGTPLAAILLGPGVATALAFLSLLLQAAFFAHGGFATLGANTLSLGLLGGGSAWLVYKGLRSAKAPVWAAAAAGGLVGDAMTYASTGGLLGWHLSTFAPAPQYDLAGYLKAIYLAYIPTQGPLAIGEMVVTGWVVHAIARQRPEVLESLGAEPRGFSRSVAALLLVCLLPLAGLLNAAETAKPAPDQAQAAEPAGEEKAAGFAGMDEAVNEHLAEQAGSPARDPYINLEAMGDAWNALMLLAGAVCGFFIGRNWDRLFKTQKHDSGEPRQ